MSSWQFWGIGIELWFLVGMMFMGMLWDNES